MDGERRYDEESLQHIYALLEKHELPEIVKMALDVINSRPTSYASFSRRSQYSQASTESRFSAVSTDYTPSFQSSTSSRSRPPRDPSLYRSGLNPTRPVPISISSPASEVFSPMDLISLPSPRPLDCDSKSIASSTTRRNGTSANDGCWFCTFCTDYKSFSAKSDWKKHETRHHETGEDWPCPFRNCTLVFDREVDYQKHCQHHHPGVTPPTDIRIQLLPRAVYGCGFDGCKAVLTGWNERCNHVADGHMKEGKKRSEWKYSNVIHNLLRQCAIRDAWKGLFSDLQSKQPRCQITWRPENTRVLKQKLECSDMRPNVDIIVHTALSLREGRPYNDVPELHPSFKTPSQDSVPCFKTLTYDELIHILRGNPTERHPSTRLNTLIAPTSHPSGYKMTTFNDPHPGTLIEFDIPPPTDANGRRKSYAMDIDREDMGLPDEPDPQIPPGLDLDPFQMDNSCSPKPLEMHYPHSVGTSPTLEGMPHQQRSSRGHILPKSIRHFASRKSP